MSHLVPALIFLLVKACHPAWWAMWPFLYMYLVSFRQTEKASPKCLDEAFLLSQADSNHHKQNQKLLCYHYTIGQ